MSQEILSKFAQLQTENRNQKQELKRYSQMLLARDEEITKLKKQIDDYQLGEKMVAKNQSYLEAKVQKDIDQVKQNQKLQQRKDNETKTTNRRKKVKADLRKDVKECLMKAKDIPTVDIKGKKYSTVNERHRHLLQYFPEARFNEEILFHDNERVVVKTELHIGETIYAVGHAEEHRNANFINKTSALENCSSSALGRCIAAFGLSGSEYASAEELVNALNNQGTTKSVSIKDEIKKQTTETKLTALYSNWKKENDSIEKSFELQQTNIKKNGGQNVKQW